MDLDIDFVRAQFPIFASSEMQGRAFFESAGGSFACAQVIDRLTRFYRERKVQPYWGFEPSKSGGEEMDEARSRVSAMLGVAADELHFGPSTTQNVYVLSQAFRQMLNAGDAIIVTNQDHEANSGAWRKLELAGIEVREWQLDPDTGHLDTNTLTNLLDEKVKLVAFPHCSNVVGEINDVAAICKIVHEAGAVTCVDGVSYAPHGFPNVQELGADIYMFSAYKTFGPHQGIMVVRRALAEKLPNQSHGFNAGDIAKKFTPAGPDHAQVAACAGMADYVDSLYSHHFTETAEPHKRAAKVTRLAQEHEERLLAPLMSYLSARNDIRLLGPRGAKNRAPTIGIELDKNGEAVSNALAKRGIMCGGGDFYAVRPLTAMGVPLEKGALRISFVHYNSAEDIDQLISALDQEL